jgi:hypothetical protein
MSTWGLCLYHGFGRDHREPYSLRSYLRSPLRGILTDFCGTVGRARFCENCAPVTSLYPCPHGAVSRVHPQRSARPARFEERNRATAETSSENLKEQ